MYGMIMFEPTDFPRLGLFTEGKVLYADLGDGKIRPQRLTRETDHATGKTTGYKLNLDWLPVENPTIRFYGDVERLEIFYARGFSELTVDAERLRRTLRGFTTGMQSLGLPGVELSELTALETLDYAWETAPITSISGANVRMMHGVFSKCANLKTINFPRLESTDDTGQPFKYAYELEKTDIYIGFIYQCPKLEQVIGNGTLYYHPQATGAVTLPDEVTKIWAYAFQGRDITSVSGANVRYIASGAFVGCSHLASVDFPKLEDIDGNVFYNTPNLNEVRSSKGIFLWRNASGAISIPEGLEVLGDCVFMENKNVTSITLPQSLRSIGGYALAGSGITAISFPTQLHTIGDECPRLRHPQARQDPQGALCQ